jgi:hypothetical protein
LPTHLKHNSKTVDELAFRADLVGEDVQEDHVGITFQEVRVAQQDMSVYQNPALRTASNRPRNRPTRGCGKTTLFG